MVIPSAEFTVRGVVLVDPTWPVEEIGTALMDCASEIDPEGDHDIAISLDLSLAEIEIECVVEGRDVSDALANASIVIHQVCECAELPVVIQGERPCPTKWLVEADNPTLTPA